MAKYGASFATAAGADVTLRFPPAVSAHQRAILHAVAEATASRTRPPATAVRIAGLWRAVKFLPEDVADDEAVCALLAEHLRVAPEASGARSRPRREAPRDHRDGSGLERLCVAVAAARPRLAPPWTSRRSARTLELSISGARRRNRGRPSCEACAPRPPASGTPSASSAWTLGGTGKTMTLELASSAGATERARTRPPPLPPQSSRRTMSRSARTKATRAACSLPAWAACAARSWSPRRDPGGGPSRNLETGRRERDGPQRSNRARHRARGRDRRAELARFPGRLVEVCWSTKPKFATVCRGKAPTGVRVGEDERRHRRRFFGKQRDGRRSVRAIDRALDRSQKNAVARARRGNRADPRSPGTARPPRW